MVSLRQLQNRISKHKIQFNQIARCCFVSVSKFSLTWLSWSCAQKPALRLSLLTVVFGGRAPKPEATTTVRQACCHPIFYRTCLLFFAVHEEPCGCRCLAKVLPWGAWKGSFVA